MEVRQDWSDAVERLAEVRSRPDGGRPVAERGRRKALQLLSEDAVDCYWRRLMELASAHLPQPPPDVELPAAARPIEDVLLYPGEAMIGEDSVVGPVQLVR